MNYVIISTQDVRVCNIIFLILLRTHSDLHDIFQQAHNDMYSKLSEEFPKISLPLQDLQAALKDLEDHQLKVTSKSELRSKSLPRAKLKPDFGPRRDFEDNRHYELDDGRDLYEMHDLQVWKCYASSVFDGEVLTFRLSLVKRKLGMMFV